MRYGDCEEVISAGDAYYVGPRPRAGFGVLGAPPTAWQGRQHLLWDVRLPEKPDTVEIRVADVCSRVDEAVMQKGRLYLRSVPPLQSDTARMPGVASAKGASPGIRSIGSPEALPADR